MIKRIKFSQSVRIGTKEVTFIDVDKIQVKIEEYNGKITILDCKSPDLETVTTMANVVYYENKRDLIEQEVQDSTGNSSEIRDEGLEPSRSKLPKASRRNK